MSIQKHQSFQFQQFTINQDRCAMKVGTDGVLLGAWAPCDGSETMSSLRILDIGTGTGLIALMMAQRFPHALIDAIEIDHEAAVQARENVAASRFADRIRVHEISLQDYAERLCEYHYDAIVSNPPYFVDSLKNPNIKRSLARHADTLPFRQLALHASHLLSDEGLFSVILPTEVQVEFENEALINRLSKNCELRIKTKPNKIAKRCMMTFTHHYTVAVKSEEVCISDADNQRSSWYSTLTKDFYLNI